MMAYVLIPIKFVVNNNTHVWQLRHGFKNISPFGDNVQLNSRLIYYLAVNEHICLGWRAIAMSLSNLWC